MTRTLDWTLPPKQKQNLPPKQKQKVSFSIWEALIEALMEALMEALIAIPWRVRGHHDLHILSKIIDKASSAKVLKDMYGNIIQKKRLKNNIEIMKLASQVISFDCHISLCQNQ